MCSVRCSSDISVFCSLNCLCYVFMSPPLSGRNILCYPCPSFRNSEIKQLSPLCFAMFWDIDLIFGMWVYNDKLQIKFTLRSGPMIFGRVMSVGLWNLAKYLVVTTLFSLCLEKLIWFLEYECIMMSYRSSLHFVLVQWSLADLWLLDFEIWLNI
jgi:hypothetical protein